MLGGLRMSRYYERWGEEGVPPLFDSLLHRRTKVVLTCSIPVVVVFKLTLALMTVAPSLGSRTICGGVLNIVTLMGISVVVVSMAASLAYVTWANRVFDPELAKLLLHHNDDWPS